MNKDLAVHHIPGTRFYVDFFRKPVPSGFPGPPIFFLSHFHGDHYSGLSAEWTRGRVICSPVTARLLVRILGVSAEFVQELEVDKRTEIDGSFVTFIDAHHCPGRPGSVWTLSPSRLL
uniref:Metallo-beta-lactamase domain-containing protein n=1 Tax=Chromera velia CCMP2878 TaxID=1169474 RepID=A0A0G4FPZ4_9ALVE|eukprot:Cvel_18175.t1-p1 / transcript=Cvel_18175.t1 / gene=Cvel_18175 / organism=Chromera_velia_CCMP2878 / gene_product=DNA cross-link repair protein SNM1, putative / transcript_product=DNA cross-link repair protein SNM1, putative / location=Cvel_scaffold1490:45022-45501(+) / protein_length=117 / sequence_SO=supercontig / SO=protein_coding / is_pseudo=false